MPTNRSLRYLFNLNHRLWSLYSTETREYVTLLKFDSSSFKSTSSKIDDSIPVDHSYKLTYYSPMQHNDYTLEPRKDGKSLAAVLHRWLAINFNNMQLASTINANWFQRVLSLLYVVYSDFTWHV